jgi:hypothetical protein
LIFSSVWTVIVVLHAFLPFAWRNMPPKHNWAISTLPDKTNTWEMNHFWCTSNYWTLCIIPCNFWKVIKVSTGISRLLFV